MTLRTARPLFALLVLQFIGLGVILPYYAFFHQPSSGFRIFVVALTAVAAVGLAGVWRRRPGALWAVLTATSAKLVVDLWNFSLGLETASLPLSLALNLAILALAFRQDLPAGPRVTRAQRVFYGFVLALAGMVGIWGMFLPADVARVLPFSVPPLHARFLGAMYLSGATFMLLGLLAREWAELRVVTPMISLWTGALGLVSLFHLEAFEWGRVQVWIWFLAYAAYPVIAAWIAWQQRTQTEPATGPGLGAAARGWLTVQGAAATALAALLLASPAWMASLWPWKIPPVLAHVYGAPFLSYGLGSLLAARRPRWGEVRIVVLATLVFTAGVFVASAIHSALFDFATPSAWIWFGSFGIASVALALLAAVPSLRSPKGTA